MRILATSLAAFVAAATNANAATYTVYFGSTDSGYSLEKSFTATNGPTVVVKAYTIDGTTLTPVTGSNVGVRQWQGLGLGLLNSPNDNSHTVDGSGLNDYLQLTFDTAVKITQASFSYAGYIANSKDGFDFYRDSTQIFTHQDIGANSSGYGTYNFVTDSYADLLAKVYGFSASWDAVVNGTRKFDSFKLKSITFETGPDNFIVPLPAALPLLASGLGGLGFLSWRKKKKEGFVRLSAA